MAMPSAECLSSDIKSLKESGISSVVCLLEVSESNRLALDSEEDSCTSQGLAFTRFPIKDYGTPDQSHLPPFIENLYNDICNGASIVVHCRGGIGRTGLVCACLLIRAGYTAEYAIRQVSEKRQQTVPETAEQITAIMDYSNHILSLQH